MRLFLDENIDIDFASLLHGHQVETARSMGWRGLENGALLALVRRDFAAMITLDRGILFQQNHSGHHLSIYVLRTPDGKMASLKSCVPALLQVLADHQPGTLREVSAEG
jgi:hypothetical protein